MKKPELIITKDGSHTVFHPYFRTNYHSIHGAISESTHVFIQNGLLPSLKEKKELRIFEFGFGTGLNTFLTYMYARNYPVHIHYETLEKHPLEMHLFKQLNYPHLLDFSLGFIFNKIHSCDWSSVCSIATNFNLLKWNACWDEYSSNNKFHLVYLDAFDPSIQPELWNLDSLTKFNDIMVKDAILCTYCAQGDFRRNLKKAGFHVESLQGPPGKREMTRAVKI